jgi:hypothetical protein
MKSRRRRLIFSKVEYGAPVAARCSVCHRPFEVELGDKEPLSAAHEKLAELFDSHTCDEVPSHPAGPVAGEATQNK